MNTVYPVICHYEDGKYWSEFPDLDGCFSQGDTQQEIIVNSRESLEGYLISLLENGHDIPEPSRLTDLKAGKNDFLSYIECDLSMRGRCVRKNVTIPEWLDRKAERAGLNFSQILKDALVAAL